jgi:hypothetical protein
MTRFLTFSVEQPASVKATDQEIVRMATALREWLGAELGKGIGISWGAQGMLTLKGIVGGEIQAEPLEMAGRLVKAPEN